MTSPPLPLAGLSLAVALALLAAGTAQATAADDRVLLPVVEVRGKGPSPADRESPPELEDGKINAGKKATRIELDAQPAIVDNNYRQLLARAPGLLISEQPVPSHYNVNYRGLGDPHESEFVLFAVDGVPVLSDWFGYPTLYFTPPVQQIRRVDFIRGGSGLLYGPQIGPVVNFIRRGAQTGDATRGRVDAVAGSNGLLSGYAEAAGGSARSGWFLSANQTSSDGERQHGGYEVRGARAAFLWQPDERQSWDFDVSAYHSDSDEPGRLTLAQFQADPAQTTTPTNEIGIDRVDASVRHQRALGDASQLTAKLFHGYQDRTSRRAAATPPGTPLPAFTTFDRQQFRVTGFDARVLSEWGSNHTLSFGTTLYSGDSPRTQDRSTDLLAERGEIARFAQQRETHYGAVFVENAFRVGEWTLVPALRQERLLMRIEEPLRLASLRRPAINQTFARSETLLGFGFNRTLGNDWRLYGNASQGYRPMRYDDVGNPTAELSAANDPESSSADSLELGLRGSPAAGWFVDVSLFRVELADKIEQRAVNVTDVERINSGDARHQGLEFQVEWNLLAGTGTGDALMLYVNGSLLDASITRSNSAALVGRTPQYAPDRVLRAGLLWQVAGGGKLAVTGTYVGEQFWQDSNLGTAALPARIAPNAVWDVSGEWPLAERLTLLAGVNNAGDRLYSSRIRSDGIEVAPRRSSYFGLRYAF